MERRAGARAAPAAAGRRDDDVGPAGAGPERCAPRSILPRCSCSRRSRSGPSVSRPAQHLRRAAADAVFGTLVLRRHPVRCGPLAVAAPWRRRDRQLAASPANGAGPGGRATCPARPRTGGDLCELDGSVGRGRAEHGAASGLRGRPCSHGGNGGAATGGPLRSIGGAGDSRGLPRGRFGWLGSDRLVLDPAPVSSGFNAPGVAAAAASPAGSAFLRWSRFPVAVVRPGGPGLVVRLYDLRYAGPDGPSWAAVEIPVETR